MTNSEIFEKIKRDAKIIAEIVENEEHKKIINRYDNLSEDNKDEIINIFRNYACNVFSQLYRFAGDENTKGIRTDVLNELTHKLDEYLENNSETDSFDLCSNLEPYLMESARRIFFNKMEKNDPKFMAFMDNVLINDFDELEKKFWVISSIYVIVGLDNQKVNKDERKRQREEIKKLLNISNLKLNFIANKVMLKTLKVAIKYVKTGDAEYAGLDEEKIKAMGIK